MPRRLLAIAVLALLLVPAASAGAAVPEHHYVAKVKGSEAFIAIVKKGDRVRAYLCDGKPNRTSLSVWFQDRLRNAAFRVTTAGVRLDATVYPRAAIGTVLLPDDRQYAFRAVLVKQRGGLLDRTDRIDGTRYRSGWIVLPDGRVRGRTSTAGTSLSGTEPTGPGIGSTSPVPPTDTQVIVSECEVLTENLKAMRDIQKALQLAKPVLPGAGATDQQLADYAARLSAWQRAVASNQSRIDAVKKRLDAVCEREREVAPPSSTAAGV